jgi:hypothetical protein
MGDLVLQQENHLADMQKLGREFSNILSATQGSNEVRFLNWTTVSAIPISSNWANWGRPGAG